MHYSPFHVWSCCQWKSIASTALYIPPLFSNLEIWCMEGHVCLRAQSRIARLPSNTAVARQQPGNSVGFCGEKGRLSPFPMVKAQGRQ